MGRPLTPSNPRRGTRRRTLLAAGVPEDLATRWLTEHRGVGVVFAEKFAEAGIPWPLVDELLTTPGLRTGADGNGLLVLWDGESTRAEVLAWARLGSLAAAYRLDALGVTPALARLFPLEAQGLDGLLDMASAARKVGIRMQDLPLWHTGRVLSLTQPALDSARWDTWRSIGVHRLGMRRAALACAAGLTPHEAAAAAEAGTLDEKKLRTLAALRQHV